MAFDTSFNILWNQRVNKEESSYLKFLDKRKEEQEAQNARGRSDRRPQRAMSEADLMSAIQSERMSNVSGPSRRGKSGLQRGRSRGTAASSSVLQKAGSSLSSPSRSVKKKGGMTFEQMQEHVFTQQMNQYIKDLEKEAKEASSENAWQKQRIQDGKQQEVDEKTKARQLAQENAKQVQAQIEENKLRRAQTRKNYVEAASSHNFPLFTETFISQEEVDQYRKDVKQNFRKELEAQQIKTQTLKNILVKRDRLYAAEKLDNNIKKMQSDHAQDHHEKVRKGNEMMRVWDRDIRLKNIKSAILSGKDATEMTMSSS